MYIQLSVLDLVRWLKSCRGVKSGFFCIRKGLFWCKKALFGTNLNLYNYKSYNISLLGKYIVFHIG